MPPPTPITRYAPGMDASRSSLPAQAIMAHGPGAAKEIERSLYAQTKAAYGIEAHETLINAHNLASSLASMELYAEAKPFLRKIISRARRSLGDEHDTTLDMRYTYARAMLSDDDATESDFREAVTILEDIERTSRRVFGPDHPIAKRSKEMLQIAREGLAELFDG